MVNKAILVGHLGKTPELRQAGGRSFCVLSVATSRRWTDKASGERRERTEWHHVEVWGGLAEQCAQFLATGRLVYVEGRLETEHWKDRATGHERHRVKVVASVVRFLGSNREAGTAVESPPPERAPAGESVTTTEAHQQEESIGAPDPVPPPDGDSFEALPMI
jgi:single-strand DNA-binding protein